MLLPGRQIWLALCVDIRHRFSRRGESSENQRCNQNTAPRQFLLRYWFPFVREGRTW
jgi:hypothetical protein